MTRADLLDLVYRYYPRGLLTNSPGYDDTEERRRQTEAALASVVEHPKWKAMLGRLRARFPVTDLSQHMLSGSFDSAYSAYVRIPGQPALPFHVSILGPYYAVHRKGSPEEEPYALHLAREIEATYGGYAAVPPEIGNRVVPDVALDGIGMGNATIYTCLLSAAWGGGLPPWM